MMKMKLAVAVAALALGTALAGAQAAQASWLDVIGAIAGAGSSSSGTSTRASSSSSEHKSHHWEKVYATDNYTIYIDTSSMEAKGEAQWRGITAWFKRVYTPEASQWLGENSNGAVKPGSIAYSVYTGYYGVNTSYSPDLQWYYYDSQNHKLYNGFLADYYDDQKFGNYIPESPNEQIKEILFKSVGWDY